MRPKLYYACVGMLMNIYVRLRRVKPLDTYLSSLLGSFLATTLIVAIAFLPNGVTALLLPFKAANIYQTAPLTAKRSVGRVHLISIIGLIHTVGLGAIILLVFLNPASAGTSTGTLSAEH